MVRSVVVMLLVASVAAGCSSKVGRLATLPVEITEPGVGTFSIAAPSSVEGGLVEVALKNAGRQHHEIQLVSVRGSHTEQEVAAAVTGSDGPAPSWLTAEGGVGNVAPGQTGTAVVTLAKGSYYLVDPGSDDGGNFFAAAGAVRILDVRGGGRGGSPPKAAATVVAKEYKFRIPALKGGKTTIRFRNEGRQPHVLVAARIAPDSTLADVKNALDVTDPTPNTPPLELSRASATAVIGPGRSLTTQLDLRAGRYVFVCLLRDRQGGPPHFARGMLAEVTVG